ncbi:hypothetical protein ACOYW6_10480 [Parablastomonas sp. CN1-191]|uniref:hypothetical protein n=1 Tax=Parablastomonas sp. CN1-191 TaxID=3400908 RepID=UPI003BF81B26
MIAAALLLFQQTAAAAPQPDIELHARVSAKSLRVERQGRAEVTVHAEPLLDKTTLITPSKLVPNGTTVSNVTVSLDAAVTLADPSQPALVTQTPSTGGNP